MEAKAMELDTAPPPQVACTEMDQMLQLDAALRDFVRVEAAMAEIGGVLDGIIGMIDALACLVRNLRCQRAQELGAPAADLVAQVREVELIFGKVSAQVERARGSMVGIVSGGFGLGGGGEAVDELAAGLERIHIGLSLSP